MIDINQAIGPARQLFQVCNIRYPLLWICHIPTYDGVRCTGGMHGYLHVNYIHLDEVSCLVLSFSLYMIWNLSLLCRSTFKGLVGDASMKETRAKEAETKRARALAAEKERKEEEERKAREMELVSLQGHANSWKFLQGLGFVKGRGAHTREGNKKFDSSP